MPGFAARLTGWAPTGWLPKWWPKFLRGYVLAAVLMASCSVLAVLMRQYERGSWERTALSGIFLLSLLVCAWWGGFGPGLLATLYGTLFASRLITPNWDLSKVSWMGVGELLAISLLLSWAAASREKTQQINQELDRRVRERTAELERANESLLEREAMLLRQTDELARSNTDLEQFAYVASHDLREPLRMIAIYTELLARRYRGSLDGQADGFIHTVLDGVQRMEALIRDLLTYSATIHAEPLPRERFEAAEAVRVAIKGLEPGIRESGARIETGPLPEVACDRVQFVRVVQNLLSNAMKYRSDAAPEIRIRADRDDGAWIFSVEDNGIGIQANYHETIFNPFKRLHGREYQGTGVGLAICRRIIERHGGRIWVESSPGKGARFRFTIPAVESAVDVQSGRGVGAGG
jgi:signal transduction histidine kinase